VGNVTVNGAASSPDDSAEATEDDKPGARSQRERVRRDRNVHKRDAGIVALLVALLSLPLLISIVMLHTPRWYPLLDWAQTEIRVRDVISSHPPSIGLAGRIGPYGIDGGSHPGPLSFYALWPAWALFGRSAFGMQVGNVVLDVAAISLTLWMAYRRGGLYMALSIAALLAVMLRAYGAFMLTSPWNPYMPVVWWFVFLMAAWSLLDEDFAMLPVAVFAGTFAMQTHVPYLGLVGGLGVFLVVNMVVFAIRHREEARAKRLWWWALIALVLFVVVWTPPVIDQIVHTPGNLRVIRDHFSDPPEPPIGASEGFDALITQINPLKLFGEELVQDGRPRAVGGATLPGLLLVAAWGAAVIGAWRMRVGLLMRLHTVVGVGLVLGFVSAARIFGDVWFYLLLWAWVLAGFMLFTIAWTLVEFIRTRVSAVQWQRIARAGVYALATVMVIATAVFGVSGARVDRMTPRLNDQLGKLAGPTVDRLREIRDSGTPGPYLVTWLPETQAIGSQGYGLLNELLRAGLDVKADVLFQPGATRYHVMPPQEGTRHVHLATGFDIARWRADPRFEEIAYYDPRTDAEREEFEQLRLEVIDELTRAGLAERVPQVDQNLFMLGLSGVPETARLKILDMLTLGLPAATFVGPNVEPPPLS
jgi:hypothetical protein